MTIDKKERSIFEHKSNRQGSLIENNISDPSALLSNCKMSDKMQKRVMNKYNEMQSIFS